MRIISCVALIGVLTASTTWADEPDARPITVAVLDFAAENAALGKQLGETIQILLSGEPGIRMVERANLTRVLQEAELNLSGLVEPTEAIKVGKLVGARIMIFGRAFALGEQMFLTAKVVGTETSLVEGVLVKSALDGDLGAATLELAGKVSVCLQTKAHTLVAQAERDGALERLRKELHPRKDKPVVAVYIPETHIEPQPATVPDPAVETEIKRMLLACGFRVQDIGKNQLSEIEGLAKGQDWPTTLDGVAFVIIGEAFSEAAARLGNLQVCAARAEINIIRRTDGKIVLADRTDQRAVDLARNVAGKTALQKSGRVLGLRVLEYFAEQK